MNFNKFARIMNVFTKIRCNNKQECTIDASSNIFEDACPGTPKYLEAQYTCISYEDNLSSKYFEFFCCLKYQIKKYPKKLIFKKTH